MGFLDIYKNGIMSEAAAAMLNFVLGVYFFGIQNNDTILNPPAGSTVGHAAFILGTLSFFAFVISVLAFLKVPFIGSLGPGDNKNTLLIAMAVGAISIFFFSGGVKSVLPLSTLGTADNFFLVIASPLVEANTFRGAIDPTLRRMLFTLKVPYANVVGMLLANVMFAYYHVAVYGLNVQMQLVAFGFGIAMSVGVSIFHSIGFEWGAHVVNNYLSVMGGLHF